MRSSAELSLFSAGQHTTGVAVVVRELASVAVTGCSWIEAERQDVDSSAERSFGAAVSAGAVGAGTAGAAGGTVR